MKGGVHCVHAAACSSSPVSKNNGGEGKKCSGVGGRC